PGERELGEQDELGAGRGSTPPALAYALGVAGDVADGGVHLAEGQAHGAILAAGGEPAGRLLDAGASRVLVRSGSFARRALARGAHAGGARERGDRRPEILGDVLEVRQRVVVAQQAEAEV